MNKLKLILIAAIIPLLSYAQVSEKPIRKNSLYLELGGSSMLYSFNYDRLIPLSRSIKLTVGAGMEYVTQLTVNEVNYGAAYCITPSANLLFGSSSHHLETGVSVFTHTSSSTLIPALRLGYRYQPRNGGFLFRAGLTPLFGFIPWGGVSFGYTF